MSIVLDCHYYLHLYLEMVRYYGKEDACESFVYSVGVLSYERSGFQLRILRGGHQRENRTRFDGGRRSGGPVMAVACGPGCHRTSELRPKLAEMPFRGQKMSRPCSKSHKFVCLLYTSFYGECPRISLRLNGAITKK
jgi:hypothetical protein